MPFNRSRAIIAGIALAVLASLTTVVATPQVGLAADRSGKCGNDTATPPEDAQWRQTFGDEFSARELDESKWDTSMFGNPDEHNHNASYASYALEENVILNERGQLNLAAEKETVVTPEGTFDYTQAFIETYSTFRQTYGFFVICAKYPEGRGLWPAFWMTGVDAWPPEFDIAEWFGGGRPDVTTDEPVMMQAHAVGPDWTDVTWYSDPVAGTAPSDGWHTYGLEWSTDKVVYYIDGVPTFEVTGQEKIPQSEMYMILNTGVACCEAGGGPPDASTVFPNYLEVDYVRAYQAA